MQKIYRPQATKIDWVFIITYLLSFIPLLFTFDALSGERQQGTLRLCLANPISRPVLLIGKFLGTLITVLIPFVFAVLLNLTVISVDSWTQLSAADWGRLGLILLIACSYAGIFVGLGLMISAGTRGLLETPGPGESGHSATDLGSHRGFYAIDPRHSLYKVDATSPNDRSISCRKRRCP